MSVHNHETSRSNPILLNQKLVHARQELETLQRSLRDLMETPDPANQALEKHSAEIEHIYHQLLDSFAALDFALYHLQLSKQDGHASSGTSSGH
jgi:hypothetical protein